MCVCVLIRVENFLFFIVLILLVIVDGLVFYCWVSCVLRDSVARFNAYEIKNDYGYINLGVCAYRIHAHK